MDGSITRMLNTDIDFKRKINTSLSVTVHMWAF